jgi:hypothetical protein
MKINHKKWPKEAWLLIFFLLAIFYFSTINKMPEKITGMHSIETENLKETEKIMDIYTLENREKTENSDCEWFYFTNEFQITNNFLKLSLKELFYSKDKLEFFAYSNTGTVIIEEDKLYFYPSKESSTVILIAKNQYKSCTKTIKVLLKK